MTAPQALPSDEPIATKQPNPPAPIWERYPFAVAWLVAFVVFALAGWRYRWLPAYHDAILNWDVASNMAARPLFPFVKSYDTGHPPLMAWLLSLLWQLPGSRFVWMHLLEWATVGLLVASVYSFARRSFGVAVGIGAALMLAAHPVVIGQSLQFNLDLPMAACAMAALAAAAAGRPAAMALAMTALCLTKLNGMFGLGPFLLYAAFGCLREGRWKSPRALVSAFWPMAVALGLFVVYHAIKRSAVGHTFDSGEFEGGQQVAFVKSLPEYLTTGYHSFYLTFRDKNGNLEICALLALAAVAAAVRAWKFPEAKAEVGGWLVPAEAAPTPRFWSPLAPAHVLLLLWLMLCVQLGLQSSRRVFTLVRYFIVVYPTLYVTLLALVALAAGRRRNVAVAAVVALAVPFFVLKWHPARLDWLPEKAARKVRFPRAEIQANGENNLLFADFLRQLQRAGTALSQRFPEGAIVDAQWPVIVYLTNPAHGITSVKFTPAWNHSDKQPDVKLDTRINGGDRTPETLNPPGYWLARVYREREVWVAVYLREGVQLKVKSGS